MNQNSMLRVPTRPQATTPLRDVLTRAADSAPLGTPSLQACVARPVDWNRPGLTPVPLAPCAHVRPAQWVIAPGGSDELRGTESLLYTVGGHGAVVDTQDLDAPVVSLRQDTRNVIRAAAVIPKHRAVRVDNHSLTEPLRLARFDLPSAADGLRSATVRSDRPHFDPQWVEPKNGSVIQFGPDSAVDAGGMVISKVPPESVTRAMWHESIHDYYYIAAGSAELWLQNPQQEQARFNLPTGSWVMLPPQWKWQFASQDAGYTAAVVVAPGYRHEEFHEEAQGGLGIPKLHDVQSLQAALNGTDRP